jgi:hypothetical protein
MLRAMLLSASCLCLLCGSADAQPRRLTRGGPVVIQIQPRSYLDPGNVVPVGSINPGISGRGQAVSYLNMPPYDPSRGRFQQYLLPDPVLNGPFVGARGGLFPIEFLGPGSRY